MDNNSSTRVAKLADTKHTQKQKDRQIVLVLQGGGALGAYQAGVYHALHEHGIEPDWIVGTSIGAINASLIAGNPHANSPRKSEGILDPDGVSAAVQRPGVDRIA